MRRHLPLTGIVVLAALLRLGGPRIAVAVARRGRRIRRRATARSGTASSASSTTSRPRRCPTSTSGSCTKAIGTSEFALRLPFALARHRARRRSMYVAGACAGGRARRADRGGARGVQPDARLARAGRALLLAAGAAARRDDRGARARAPVVVGGAGGRARWRRTTSRCSWWCPRRSGCCAARRAASVPIALPAMHARRRWPCSRRRQPGACWIAGTSSSARAFQIPAGFFVGLPARPRARR